MANETYADPYADLIPAGATPQRTSTGEPYYVDPYADLPPPPSATRNIPIVNYPEIQREMAKEGIETAKAGYRLATQQPGGATLGGVGRGALGMVGGATEYAFSPVLAAYRSAIGEPTQKLTRGYIPKEYSEFAAQLATPGVGLLPAVGRAAVAPTVARSLPGGTPLLEAARDLNIALPRAVTSESPTVQRAGKIMEAVPGLSVPVQRASQRAIEQLGESAAEASARLGSGQPAAAGVTAREAIESSLARGPMKRRVDALYNRVDHMVDPAATAPLSKTLAQVMEIDRARLAAGLPRSKVSELLDEPLRRSGGLTYQGVKDLRSYVGEMMKGRQPIPEGMSRSEVESVYGPLSEDLRGAVAAGGGQDALRVWERANAMAGNWARTRKQLADVLKVKSDEGIVDKVHGMMMDKGGDLAQLLNIRRNIPSEHWDELASGVLGRMGWRAGGTGFSPADFLTQYNKMSPQAQALVFGDVKPMIDSIATVSMRFKDLQRYANPSGTGQTVIGAAMGAAGGYGAMLHPILALTAAAKAAPAIGAAYAAAKWLASPQGSSALRAVAGAAPSMRTAANSIFAMAAARAIGADPHDLMEQLQGPQR